MLNIFSGTKKTENDEKYQKEGTRHLEKEIELEIIKQKMNTQNEINKKQDDNNFQMQIENIKTQNETNRMTRLKELEINLNELDNLRNERNNNNEPLIKNKNEKRELKTIDLIEK